MKPKEITVVEFLAKCLKERGYHGLYRDRECACLVGDLMPCGEYYSDCMPGRKISCDPEFCPAYGDCDWHIGPLPEKEESDMQRIFPKRLGPARQWRQKKRKELREALKALKVCRFGCAYTPQTGEVQRAINEIGKAIELCNVKNWGR